MAVCSTRGDIVLHDEIDRALARDPQFQGKWSTSLYPVRMDDEVVGVAVMLIDTTERAATEATRQELAAIVDGSGDAIFGVTENGVVTSWNAAAGAAVRV